MDILDYILLLNNKFDEPPRDTTDSDLQDSHQDIDFMMPRNESELYQRKTPLEYGYDIAKFCFTDGHKLGHINDVIKDMNHFIRFGEHFTYKHRKQLDEGSKL